MAEAIKKWLIIENFHSEIWKQFVNIIWNCITSTTLAILENQQNELLFKLCPKEQDYFLKYYYFQNNQFLLGYTKHFPNLGFESTQIAKSFHGPSKLFTNRYTPISDSVTKIAFYFQIIQHEFQIEVYAKLANLPNFIDG